MTAGSPSDLTSLKPLPDEAGRLAALHRYRILDTLPEGIYDDVVDLARTICGTPQAVLTFIDAERRLVGIVTQSDLIRAMDAAVRG